MIELQPDTAYNYYYRGNFYRDYLKDYEKSIEDYTTAIELNPDDVEFYYKRSDSYELNNELNESMLDHLKTIEMDSSYHAYANYKIGNIYSKLKNELINAEKYLLKSIELDYWDLPASHNSLGYVYLNNNEYDKALKEFNTALALKPENTNYILGKVNYFVLTNEFNLAIKLCKKLLEINNKDPHTYYILADIYNNKNFVNNSQTKSLINISLAIDKLTYLGDYDYFITDYYNLERIELVDLYKFRAKIFETLNENSFSCSDYNKVLELIDNDSADANSVVLLISKNCSD